MRKINQLNLTPYYKLMLAVCLLGILVVTHYSSVGASQQGTAVSADDGYTALRLFLRDEQHLTTIRRVKMVIAFKSISDSSSILVDEIADTSDHALDELEKLATARPTIVFEEFSDESIARATLDSLRMKTAKEFLLETDNFEKNLLLSQTHVLRVISHLAEQLKQKESNVKRREWLDKIALRYEDFYQQVYTLLTVAT